MYRVGDYVKHNRYGICVVTEKTKRKNANKEVKKYYVLKTLNGVDTTIVTPIDSKDLVEISSMEEIKDLFSKMGNLPNIWINDNQERNEKFREILRTGSILECATLVETLYAKKKEKNAENKTLSANDSRILTNAEKKLFDELAYTLNIDVSEVSSYIENKINASK